MDAARNADKIVLSSKDKRDYADGSLVLYKGTPRIIRDYLWANETESSKGLVKRVTHVKLENGVEGIKVPIADLRINIKIVHLKNNADNKPHAIKFYEMDPVTGLVTHIILENGTVDGHKVPVENVRFA